MFIRAVVLALAVGGLTTVSAPAQDTSKVHIAGINPSERPAWAPVIKEYKKDAEWYAKALTGIIPPYPASLRFLEDQGAWFNPFLHPGMTGPYDIRHWHAAK